jgi:environmental stress-induced protein Ves
MPWKNGGGTTVEIAVAPNPGGPGGPFLWRLSVARVTQSGPFSAFPGVDRTIVLLRGDGLILDSDADGRHRLDRALVPYSFSGDWSTTGVLLGGESEDFNVMTDRQRYRHEVTVEQLTGVPGPLPPGRETALYLAAGRARIVAGDASFDLRRGDCLLGTAGRPLLAAGDGDLIVVELEAGAAVG